LVIFIRVNEMNFVFVLISFTSDSVNFNYIALVTEITRLNELNVVGQLNDFNSVFLQSQFELIREQNLLHVDLLNLIPLIPKIKKGNYPLFR